MKSNDSEKDQPAIVYSEADRRELIEIITEKTPGFVTAEHVEAVVREFPEALAALLLRSTPNEDGEKRAEIFDNLIIRVVRREESEGHGIGEGVTIPAHFAVYMKAHDGFLEKLESALGMTCKNG